MSVHERKRSWVQGGAAPGRRAAIQRTRAWVATGIVTSLIGGLWLLAAPVGAQDTIQPVCQARSDLAVAVQDEDDAATGIAADLLVSSAPTEITAAASTLSDLVEKRGHEALAVKKGHTAIRAIDEYIATTCGFPVLDVRGFDYVFQGLSSPMVAGTYVVQFTNEAPAEHHELVLFEVEAGVDLPVKKLLRSAGESNAPLNVIGATFAKPGVTDTLVVVLDPGRYVYACFIDVETTTGDADEHGGHGGDEHGGAADPHWREGMRGELEVVGGA